MIENLSDHWQAEFEEAVSPVTRLVAVWTKRIGKGHVALNIMASFFVFHGMSVWKQAGISSEEAKDLASKAVDKIWSEP